MKIWGVWADRHSRVVVRGTRAVALSIVEFRIWSALRSPRPRTRAELLDAVFDGVGEPPLQPGGTVTAAVRMLRRKLSRLGIDVTWEGNNGSHRSLYHLTDLEQKDARPAARQDPVRVRRVRGGPANGYGGLHRGFSPDEIGWLEQPPLGSR